MGLRMEIGTGVGAGNVSRSGNGSGKLEQEREQGRDEYALTGRVPDRASRPRQDVLQYLTRCLVTAGMGLPLYSPFSRGFSLT